MKSSEENTYMLHIKHLKSMCNELIYFKLNTESQNENISFGSEAPETAIRVIALWKSKEKNKENVEKMMLVNEIRDNKWLVNIEDIYKRIINNYDSNEKWTFGKLKAYNIAMDYIFNKALIDYYALPEDDRISMLIKNKITDSYPKIIWETGCIKDIYRWARAKKLKDQEYCQLKKDDFMTESNYYSFMSPTVFDNSYSDPLFYDVISIKNNFIEIITHNAIDMISPRELFLNDIKKIYKIINDYSARATVIAYIPTKDNLMKAYGLKEGDKFPIKHAKGSDHFEKYCYICKSEGITAINAKLTDLAILDCTTGEVSEPEDDDYALCILLKILVHA